MPPLLSDHAPSGTLRRCQLPFPSRRPFDAFLRRGSSGPKATSGQEQGADSNKSFSLHGDCYTDRGEVLLIGICFCRALVRCAGEGELVLGLTKHEGTLLRGLR